MPRDQDRTGTELPELHDAMPGALPADCFVCGIGTKLRVPVGDGAVPLCSEECRRAFPSVQRLSRALEAAIAFGEEGWMYASDYFRDKWKFEERRRELRNVLGVAYDAPLREDLDG